MRWIVVNIYNVDMNLSNARIVVHRLAFLSVSVRQLDRNLNLSK